MKEALQTLSEIAKLSPYSAEYLSLLARQGKLRATKIDGVWHATPASLQGYMTAQRASHKASDSLLGAFTVVAPEVVASVPEARSTGVSMESVLESPQKKESAYMETPAMRVPRGEDRAHRDDEMFVAFLSRFVKFMDMSIAARQGIFRRSVVAFQKTFRDVTSRTTRTGALLILIAVLALSPVRGAWSAFDAVVDAAWTAVRDADTLMGHRAGTGAGDVLLLDAEGKVSIRGHIETDGQLRSHITDGVAPIVVDSMTKVENLNADYIDGLSAEQFTLAFVTKNGNVTYEDVHLEGAVSVGKSLLVRGATKLLSELEVNGNIRALGDVDIAGSLRVHGFTRVRDLEAEGFIIGDVVQGRAISARESVSAPVITGSTEVNAGNLYVSGQSYFTGVAEFKQSIFGKNASFTGSLSADDFGAFGRTIKLGNQKSNITVKGEHFTYNGADVCTTDSGCNDTSGWEDSGTVVHLDTAGDSVVIGTSTPAFTAGLVIEQRGSAPTLAIGDTGTTSPFLFIDAKGNVGLGTTSPSAQLALSGNGYFGGTIKIAGAGTSTAANGFDIVEGCYAIESVCVAGGSAGSVQSGTANRVAYYANASSLASADFFAIDGVNERVGIGSTTPSRGLSVEGDATVTGDLRVGTLRATSTVTFDTALGATSGGTGQDSYTQGDVLYASGANTLARLGVGAKGQVLGVSGLGIPAWVATSSNASTIDGLDSTQFLRKDATDTFTGTTLTISAVSTVDLDGTLDISGNLIVSDASVSFGAVNTNFDVLGNFTVNTNDLTVHKSTGNVGINTTTPAQALSVGGSGYLTGGLGIGNATTTSGVLETSGLAYIGGILKVAGSATSTFANGIDVGEGCVRVRGTCLGAGGGTFSSFTVSGDAGTPEAITDANTLTVVGGKNISTIVSATDTLILNLSDTLFSMGDIFATSTGASVYASSTIQSATLIGYTGGLFGGTTTSWNNATVAIEQNGASPAFVVGDAGSSSPSIYIGGHGGVSIGTTTQNEATPLFVESSRNTFAGVTIANEQYGTDALAGTMYLNNEGDVAPAYIAYGSTGHSDALLGGRLNVLAPNVSLMANNASGNIAFITGNNGNTASWMDSTGNFLIGTSTTDTSIALRLGHLGGTGDAYVSGGLGIGNATTTDGVLETSGLAYIGGVLKVAGTATSTFSGGVYANTFQTNLPSCDSLDTDATGAIICGTDAAGAGASTFTVAADAGTPETISDTNVLTVVGGKNISTNISATDTLILNLSDTLFSMGDIFATSTGASVYASSTIQATGNILGYDSIGRGTTSPARRLSIEGDALITGSLKTGALTSTSTITALGTGTSTFTGGLSVGGGGLASSKGLTISGGNVILPAGTIDNAELANSTVSYGGVSLSLGGSDATPAFNLADATGLPIVAGTTGTLTVPRGGTGLTAVATGDILYGASTDTLSALTAGTRGSILGITTGGIPGWIATSTFAHLATNNTFTGNNIFSNSLIITGNGTTTLNQFLDAERVSAYKTLRIGGTATTTIAGDNATSTFSGGIHANAFQTNLLLCDSLDTDATGAIVCGTDADANTTYTAGNNLSLNSTEFALKTNLFSMGDIFATSTGASLYASSTIQSATLIGYTGGLFGGTTTSWNNATVAIEQNGASPAFVVGDNGTSSPFIYVNGKGNVGIGSSSPSATLSLAGKSEAGGRNAPFAFMGIGGTGGANGGDAGKGGGFKFVGGNGGESDVQRGGDGGEVFLTAGNGGSGGGAGNGTGGSLYFNAGTGSTNGNIIVGNILGNLGVATTSPAQKLSVAGSGYLTGGLGIGNATTTNGVLETSGLAYIGGLLKVAGTGTSTFGGGIYANSIQTNLPSCDSLDTDATGAIICGTDATGGGGSSFTLAADTGTPEAITDTNTLTVVGGKNIATIVSATDTLTLNLSDTLFSMGDIFATSTGASVYASSTIQATGDILGYSKLFIGGTTSQALADVAFGGAAGVTKDVYVSGGLGVGNATTSDGNIQVAGIVQVGNATTYIKGSATSTFSNGIAINGGGLNIALPSCSALTTDASGAVICGTSTAGDAATLDGLDSTQFLRRDATDSFVGTTLTISAISTLGVDGTLNVNGALSVSDPTVVFDAASTDFALTGNFTINTNDLTVHKSTGYVGINSTTPAQALSVGGSGYLTGGLGIGNATTSSGVLETSGLAYIGGSLKVAGASTSTIASGLSITAGGLRVGDLNSCDSIDTNATGGLICGTDANTTYTAGNNLSLNSTEFALKTNLFSMGDIFATTTGASLYASSTIQSTGDILGYSKLFIGGTTSQALADVAFGGATGVTKDVYVSGGLGVGNATTSDGGFVVGNDFYVYSNGNVGIGSSSPQVSLVVKQNDNGKAIQIDGGSGSISTLGVTGDGAFYLSAETSGGASPFMSFQSADDEWGYLFRSMTGSQYLNMYVTDTGGVDYANFIVGATNATTGLVVTDAGTVGIGSTSPWGILSVEQKSSQSVDDPIFNVSDMGTTSPFLFVSQKGYVGIGTKSPTSILYASGTVGLSGTTGGDAPDVLTITGGRGGNSTTANQTGAGSDISLTAGSGGNDSTTVGAGGRGGNVAITAGDSGVAWTGGNPGDITLTAGTSRANVSSLAEGGVIALIGGDGAAGPGFCFPSCSNGFGGPGGPITLTAGNGGSAAVAGVPGNGGDITIQGGLPGSLGAYGARAGQITLNAAVGTGGIGYVGVGTSSPWGMFSVEQGPIATNYQKQGTKPVFVVSDTGTSSPFIFVTQKGVVSFGSSTPSGLLRNSGDVTVGRAAGVTNDVYISGGLGVGQATTTDKNIALGTLGLIYADSWHSNGTSALCKTATGASAGAIVDCSGTPIADYAEFYATTPDVTYGHIVAISSENVAIDKYNGQSEKISGEDVLARLKRSSKPYDETIIGIASDNYNDFSSIGHNRFSDSENPLPVALVGRVPVKVTTEGGSIKKGDRITSSSLAGVGMRASRSGNVVGIALADFDESSAQTTAVTTVNDQGVSETKTVKAGEVMVFVNLGYHKIDENVSHGALAQGDEPWTVDANTGRIATGFDADLGGKALFNVREIASANGTWALTADGTLRARKIDADEVIAGRVLTRRLGFLQTASAADNAVGSGRILRGQTDTIIYSNIISPRSKIFVSFTSDLGGRSWYIKDKIADSSFNVADGGTVTGMFRVGISSASPDDLNFDWWVVDAEGDEPMTEVLENTGTGGEPPIVPPPPPAPEPEPTPAPDPEPTPVLDLTPLQPAPEPLPEIAPEPVPVPESTPPPQPSPEPEPIPEVVPEPVVAPSPEPPPEVIDSTPVPVVESVPEPTGEVSLRLNESKNTSTINP